MKREILINGATRETRVAILEDDRLVELLVDQPEIDRTVGNIYLGKVEAVLHVVKEAESGTWHTAVTEFDGGPYTFLDALITERYRNPAHAPFFVWFSPQTSWRLTYYSLPRYGKHNLTRVAPVDPGKAGDVTANERLGTVDAARSAHEKAAGAAEKRAINGHGR